MKVRLYAAAALCIVALGVGYQTDVGSPGYATGGYQYDYVYDSYTGYYEYEYVYHPGFVVGGEPVSAVSGAGADVRGILVPAAVVLAWAASHRTRGTRRAAQLATAGLVLVAVIAASRGMAQGTIAATGAAALAWPVLGLRPRRGPASVAVRTGSG